MTTKGRTFIYKCFGCGKRRDLTEAERLMILSVGEAVRCPLCSYPMFNVAMV